MNPPPKAPRTETPPARPAAPPPETRPRFPSDAEIERELGKIPKLIVWKIAQYPILRTLLPAEAYKVRIAVVNYRESHEMCEAARDIETLLKVGPQLLVRGALAGAQWDDGMRQIRLKMRELHEAIAKCARDWQITLDTGATRESGAAGRAPAPPERRGKGETAAA